MFHDVMLYLRMWRVSQLLLGQDIAKTACIILLFLVSSSLLPPDSRFPYLDFAQSSASCSNSTCRA